LLEHYARCHADLLPRLSGRILKDVFPDRQYQSRRRNVSLHCSFHCSFFLQHGIRLT
jgi:hypothetical protein